VREGESPWAEEGEENLKLMTVHKAKGLEFPVVFLANLASERQRRQSFIPLRPQGTFQAAVGNFKTGGYDSALEQEKRKMEAEDRRLLYVAATRARDHLVIPLFRGKRKGLFSLLGEKLPEAEQVKPWSVIDAQLMAGEDASTFGRARSPPEAGPRRAGKGRRKPLAAAPSMERNPGCGQGKSLRGPSSPGSFLCPSRAWGCFPG